MSEEEDSEAEEWSRKATAQFKASEGNKYQAFFSPAWRYKTDGLAERIEFQGGEMVSRTMADSFVSMSFRACEMNIGAIVRELSDDLSSIDSQSKPSPSFILALERLRKAKELCAASTIKPGTEEESEDWKVSNILGYERGSDALAAANHPDHYGGKDNPYEVVKVAEAWGMDKDAYLFNVLKYIGRAGKKDPAKEVEDLQKAVWYLNRKIQLLQSEIS